MRFFHKPGVMVIMLIVVSGFLSAAFAAPTWAGSANLLANPGFEEISDGEPMGWNRYAPEGSAIGLQVSSEARSGKYAGLIDVDTAIRDGDDGWARVEWYQRLAEDGAGLAEPGAKYRFSVYYRTSGEPQGRLVVQIPGQTHPFIELPPSDEWRYTQLEFTWPAQGVSAAPGVWAWNAIRSGKIWFDDAELVPVEEQRADEVEIARKSAPAVIQAAIDPEKHINITGGSYLENALRTIPVATLTELRYAIDSAQAGDVIILADGVYVDEGILRIYDKHGTADNPIVIAAANIGRAEIAGRLQFAVNHSSYIVIEGLFFTTSGELSAAGSRALIISNSYCVRVTRNHFALLEIPGSTSFWVYIEGKTGGYNRIDHNLFENKLQLGNFIVLDVADDIDTMPRYTRIDHNHFRNMAPLGRNGMEVIRVGDLRFMSQINSYTTIEYNLFERVDGERSEIISLKNSGNVIAYNTIIETEGSITLRYGDNNLVTGNYFLGNGKPHSGGVCIYGNDQHVINNYFQGLDSAIILGGGNTDDVFALGETGYVRVNNALIASNTYIDNNNNISYLDQSGRYTLAPINTVIANNLFYTHSSAAHILGHTYPIVLGLTGVDWQGNLAFGPGRSLIGINLSPAELRIVDPQLVLSIDDMYYIDKHSPALDAGIGSFPDIVTDIEGKPRDTHPDVGAFEYSGYPLLRGPLTPRQVGPYAEDHETEFSLDAPGIYITRLEISGVNAGNTSKWWGQITVHVDGVLTGQRREVETLTIHIDGNEVYQGRGLPAKVIINSGELKEGEHLLVVFAACKEAWERRELYFVTQNIMVKSPDEQGRVQGEWPILFAVGLPDNQIRRVQILVDGEQLFSGSSVPDNIVIDSSTLADGEHVLTVDVLNIKGVLLQKNIKFIVQNYWLLEDPLLPPVNFGVFGLLYQTRTSRASIGWRYATDNAQDFTGDADRMTRSIGDTTEFLVWDTPRLTAASVVIFTRNPELIETVKLAISSDSSNFTEISYDARSVEYTEGGWHKFELVAEVTNNEDANYFYLQLCATDTQASDIQIGHVTMRGRWVRG